MAKGTVNKVIILGRLGQDPEVRATAGGTQVVNLNVATNELGPKDESGMRQDLTEWHRCVLFGRTAEVAAQYLRKGSLVYLEGRLQTRKWQDQQGNDKYSTEIVAYEMQMMGGRDNAGQPDQQGGYQQATPQPQRQQPANRPAAQPAPQQGGNSGFQQGRYQQPQQPAPQQNPQQPQQGNNDPFNNDGFFDDDIPF